MTDGCLSNAHPLSMGGKSMEQREDPAWLRCAHLYPQEEEWGVTHLALASPYTPWKIPKDNRWKLLPLYPTHTQALCPSVSSWIGGPCCPLCVWDGGGSAEHTREVALHEGGL